MGWRKQVRILLYSRLKAVLAPAEIKAYFRATPEPKVNIGCGKNLVPGWLNTDLYPHFGATRMDAAKGWPVPPSSLRAVLCEHMIEHVPKSTAQHMMRGAFHALKSGGMVRIVTPDLESFARFALEPNAPETGEYVRGLETVTGARGLGVCDAVNQIFYEHGHRHIYTRDSLTQLLRDAGFSEFAYMRGGEYHDPLFHGVDGHVNVIGARMNAIEAMAIEARKA